MEKMVTLQFIGATKQPVKNKSRQGTESYQDGHEMDMRPLGLSLVQGWTGAIIDVHLLNIKQLNN